MKIRKDKFMEMSDEDKWTLVQLIIQGDIQNLEGENVDLGEIEGFAFEHDDDLFEDVNY